jgi:hypothetical protein
MIRRKSKPLPSGTPYPNYGHPIKENNQKARQEQQDFLFCSIRKSDKVVTDLESGEIICSNCGMIISDKI